MTVTRSASRLSKLSLGRIIAGHMYLRLARI